MRSRTSGQDLPVDSPESTRLGPGSRLGRGGRSALSWVRSSGRSWQGSCVGARAGARPARAGGDRRRGLRLGGRALPRAGDGPVRTAIHRRAPGRPLVTALAPWAREGSEEGGLGGNGSFRGTSSMTTHGGKTLDRRRGLRPGGRALPRAGDGPVRTAVHRRAPGRTLVTARTAVSAIGEDR